MRRPPRRRAASTDRKYLLERVADAVVQMYRRVQGPALREKALPYLYQAVLAGRDIFYDQKHAHNLEMRDALEAIVSHPDGVDKTTLAELTRYTKLFWINSGPYNNKSARKFVLTCTPDAFAAAVRTAAKSGAVFPAAKGETLDQLLARLQPMFFDPNVDPMVTAKTPPPGKDILTASANNLYSGVSMKDLEGFRERYSLNSRLIKQNGKIVGRSAVSGGFTAIIGSGSRDSVDRADGARALSSGIRRRGSRPQAYTHGSRTSAVINGFTEVYLTRAASRYARAWFYANREKTTGIQASRPRRSGSKIWL